MCSKKSTMVIALVFLVSVSSATVEAAGVASWHDQLMELGYHIFHLSSINVINGLNLSRAQAVRFRELARQVQRDATPIRLNTRVPKEMVEVRAAYRDLARLLSRGEQPGPAMEARIVRARRTEAKIIRDSLMLKPTSADRGVCTRCHLPLKRTRLKRASGADSPLSGHGLYSSPEAKKDVARAHIVDFLGMKATRRIAAAAVEIDGLLSDAQKDVMGKFSCCLIPPTDMSNPVRVGQVAVSDRMMTMFRKVRSVPDEHWLVARRRVVDVMVEMQGLRQPGIPEAKLTEAERRIETVLEKTRRMSETEFEMNKEELCLELRGPDTSAGPERFRKFKQAFFLLMPGSVETYDKLLVRMRRH